MSISNKFLCSISMFVLDNLRRLSLISVVFVLCHSCLGILNFSYIFIFPLLFPKVGSLFDVLNHYLIIFIFLCGGKLMGIFENILS